MKTLGIIPARYAATRLPGKPLKEINGKSIVQRVYEQAQAARLIDQVIVATDDERIYKHVIGFGGQAVITSTSHNSGTDRCAEVAAAQPEYDLVVNIQGDEPFIDPAQIDLSIRPLLQAEYGIATLAIPIQNLASLKNPNMVKVVIDKQNKALYFSRSPIPFIRNHPEAEWLRYGTFFKHIGLYAFKRAILLEVAALEMSDLEQQESLEQLRWIDNGYHIYVNKTDKETIGIDTIEDLETARAKFKRNE